MKDVTPPDALTLELLRDLHRVFPLETLESGKRWRVTVPVSLESMGKASGSVASTLYLYAAKGPDGVGLAVRSAPYCTSSRDPE